MTTAAARGDGKGGPLTPRLQQMAAPAFSGLGAAAQARELQLPESGAGSIMTRSRGRILVEIRVTDTGAATLDRLRTAGANPVHVAPSVSIITAEVAPADLTGVAEVQPQVISVQEILQPAVNAACPTGDYVSEGDGAAQLRAKLARDAHGVDGSGVTVGVLSDTYDMGTPWAPTTNATQDVAEGELPGTSNPCGYSTAVDVLKEGPAAGSWDEGRAMIQIVHDLAPGAGLRFATANDGEQDFADQIRALADSGAQVIVDDYTYFAEPMYQDGVIAKAVEDVTAQGVTYFSSAANSNNVVEGKDVGSYEAQAFRPTTCPDGVAAALGGTPTCHDFDPGDASDPTYGATGKNGWAQYMLGWNEPQFGITTDLDMCMLDGAGAVKMCSSADNLRTQNTFESFYFATAEDADYSLVIARYSGKNTPRFKIVTRWADVKSVEYDTSAGGDIVGPTIFGHNASRSGVSVAADPYDNPDTLEDYSSHGPASWCYGPVDGTTPATPITPCESATVDMTATDGVLTSFFYPQDGGGPNRFYGTSASAPHAAAVAALVLSEKTCLSPAQVIAAMKETAVPVGSYGEDAAGAGRLQADAALEAGDAAACDTSPPQVTVTFPTAPPGGWFNDAPLHGTVTAADPRNIAAITCTGATMGPLTGRYTPSASASLTVSAQGATEITCTATDVGGNTGSAGGANATMVAIDNVPPNVACQPATFEYGQTSATVSASVSDSGSGPVAATVGALVPTSAAGTFTVTLTGTDKVGNTNPAACSYRVLAEPLDPLAAQGPPLTGNPPAPGTALVQVNGQSVVAPITRDATNGLIQLAGPGWIQHIQAVDSSGAPIPLTSGVLQLIPGQYVVVSGSGFAPNGQVKAWLVPTPTALGNATTDASGSFTVRWQIPGGTQGNRTLQVNAMSPAGEVRSISQGVQMATQATGRASASAKKSKLRITVAPRCKAQYKVRVQKMIAGGNGGSVTVTWKTRRGGYLTSGKHPSRVINLPKGNYRAVVTGACGWAGFTTNTVALKR